MHSLLSVSLLRFLSSWLSQLQYSLLVCEQALISPTAQLAKLTGFRGGGWRERVRGWVREGSAIVSFAVYHWSVTWRCVTPQKLVMKKKQFNFHFTVRSHVNKRHRLCGIVDIFFCTLLKASFKLAPYHFSKMILVVSLTTQRGGGHFDACMSESSKVSLFCALFRARKFIIHSGEQSYILMAKFSGISGKPTCQLDNKITPSEAVFECAYKKKYWDEQRSSRIFQGISRFYLATFQDTTGG